MPVNILDVDDGLGNIISVSGFVGADEYIDALVNHFSQDPHRFSELKFNLTDLTGAIGINYSYDTIRTIADHCNHASALNPNAVVAVVSDEELTYGLARMWQLFMDEKKWEINLLRDIEAAKAWIRLRLKEKFGLHNISFSE